MQLKPYKDWQISLSESTGYFGATPPADSEGGEADTIRDHNLVSLRHRIDVKIAAAKAAEKRTVDVPVLIVWSKDGGFVCEPCSWRGFNRATGRATLSDHGDHVIAIAMFARSRSKDAHDYASALSRQATLNREMARLRDRAAIASLDGYRFGRKLSVEDANELIEETLAKLNAADKEGS